MFKPWWMGVVAVSLLGWSAFSGQAAAADMDVAAEVGEYWLGVAVGSPGPALQAQLALPKDQGLVVENVRPESPAAKAGLQPYDVLVKANGHALASPRDLIDEINKVKEGKLALDVIRGMKHQTVTATPGKRPPGGLGFENPPMPQDAESIRGWIKQMMPEGREGHPLQFRFFHPGQILPPGAAMPPGASGTMSFQMSSSTADGYKIEIRRENNNPAKITVTKDKEKWEVTENELGKLPEQIRPQVEQMLHGSSVHVFTAPGQPMMGGGGNFGYSGPPGPGAILPFGMHDRHVQQQLGDLNRQLDEVRKSVNELRAKAGLTPLPEPKPAPEKKPEKKSEKKLDKKAEKSGARV